MYSAVNCVLSLSLLVHSLICKIIPFGFFLIHQACARAHHSRVSCFSTSEPVFSPPCRRIFGDLVLPMVTTLMRLLNGIIQHSLTACSSRRLVCELVHNSRYSFIPTTFPTLLLGGGREGASVSLSFRFIRVACACACLYVCGWRTIGLFYCFSALW